MEIDSTELERLLESGEKVLLVDVRQPWEHEIARLSGSTLIPLPEFPARAGEIQPAPGQRVVCYCHHGLRSLQAAQFLRAAGIDALSLRGGIDAWSQIVDPKTPRY